MNLQQLLSYVRSAADDFGMISEGDCIGVGLSGGKDSLSLLVALNALRRFYPNKFELHAVTVSLGFPEFDNRPAARLCEELGLPYHVVNTNIADVVFNIRKEKNPCSLCANMRRGSLNAKLKELGCNKSALGHNRDDVIETFFLSLFYEGRAWTFQPVTYLDRMNLHAIRPLIYASENEIQSFIRQSGLTVVRNPCPVDGHTRREHIKGFIKERSAEYESFKSKMFNAIKGLPGWTGEK